MSSYNFVKCVQIQSSDASDAVSFSKQTKENKVTKRRNDEEDSTSMVQPSVNSNRDSLTADALRQFRKNLPSSNFNNTITSTTNKSLSKAAKVAGIRFQTQIRLEFISYKL